MDGWQVVVTDDDIRGARRRWNEALDAGEPSERVELFYDDLRRMVSAQAQQIAEEFRAAQAARRAGSSTPQGD
jgi:hypothetical protein